MMTKKCLSVKSVKSGNTFAYIYIRLRNFENIHKTYILDMT